MEMTPYEMDVYGPPAPSTLSRRKFLRRAGAVAGVASLAAVFGFGAKDTFEWALNQGGRNRTGGIFENEGLWNWDKLTVVPDLVQVDSSVKVSRDMFSSTPNIGLGCPPRGIFLAQQPIAVKNTILRNIADYSSGQQSDMDRALPAIPDGLIAFYMPGPGNFVYLDADKNDGLLVPLNDGSYIWGDHLGIADVDIDGREARGDVSYPYTKQDEVVYPRNYNNATDFYNQTLKAKEKYQFIGQSLIIDNSVQLEEIQYSLVFNEWPIQFPQT
jgi:hypothetical protein